jgi:hypothetical protein
MIYSELHHYCVMFAVQILLFLLAHRYLLTIEPLGHRIVKGEIHQFLGGVLRAGSLTTPREQSINTSE